MGYYTINRDLEKLTIGIAGDTVSITADISYKADCEDEYTVLETKNITSTAVFNLSNSKGLYRLRIQSFNAAKAQINLEELIIPMYEVLFTHMIKDMEFALCGCGDCPGCKGGSCDGQESNTLSTLYKMLSYLLLNKGIYEKTLINASNCLSCSILDLNLCLVRTELYAGNHGGCESYDCHAVKKIIAYYYYVFYYTDSLIQSDKQKLDRMYKFDHIRRCISNYGIDTECIKKSAQTSPCSSAQSSNSGSTVVCPPCPPPPPCPPCPPIPVCNEPDIFEVGYSESTLSWKEQTVRVIVDSYVKGVKSSYATTLVTNGENSMIKGYTAINGGISIGVNKYPSNKALNSNTRFSEFKVTQTVTGVTKNFKIFQLMEGAGQVLATEFTSASVSGAAQTFVIPLASVSYGQNTTNLAAGILPAVITNVSNPTMVTTPVGTVVTKYGGLPVTISEFPFNAAGPPTRDCNITIFAKNFISNDSYGEVTVKITQSQKEATPVTECPYTYYLSATTQSGSYIPNVVGAKFKIFVTSFRRSVVPGGDSAYTGMQVMENTRSYSSGGPTISITWTAVNNPTLGLVGWDGDATVTIVSPQETSTNTITFQQKDGTQLTVQPVTLTLHYKTPTVQTSCAGCFPVIWKDGACNRGDCIEVAGDGEELTETVTAMEYCKSDTPNNDTVKVLDLKLSDLSITGNTDMIESQSLVPELCTSGSTNPTGKYNLITKFKKNDSTAEKNLTIKYGNYNSYCYKQPVGSFRTWKWENLSPVSKTVVGNDYWYDDFQQKTLISAVTNTDNTIAGLKKKTISIDLDNVITDLPYIITGKAVAHGFHWWGTQEKIIYKESTDGTWTQYLSNATLCGTLFGEPIYRLDGDDNTCYHIDSSLVGKSFTIPRRKYDRCLWDKEVNNFFPYTSKVLFDNSFDNKKYAIVFSTDGGTVFGIREDFQYLELTYNSNGYYEGEMYGMKNAGKNVALKKNGNSGFIALDYINSTKLDTGTNKHPTMVYKSDPISQLPSNNTGAYSEMRESVYKDVEYRVYNPTSAGDGLYVVINTVGSFNFVKYPFKDLLLPGEAALPDNYSYLGHCLAYHFLYVCEKVTRNTYVCDLDSTDRRFRKVNITTSPDFKPASGNSYGFVLSNYGNIAEDINGEKFIVNTGYNTVNDIVFKVDMTTGDLVYEQMTAPNGAVTLGSNSVNGLWVKPDLIVNAGRNQQLYLMFGVTYFNYNFNHIVQRIKTISKNP